MPDLTAETFVLGALILDSEVCARYLPLLAIRDFQLSAHRLIFVQVQNLYYRGQPCDFISVTDALRAVDQLEEVGGSSYVMSLVHTPTTLADIDRHICALAAASLASPSLAARMLGELALLKELTDHIRAAQKKRFERLDFEGLGLDVQVLLQRTNRL